MDNREITGGTVVTSLPSSPGNLDGIERQGPVTPTPIRKAWAEVTTPIMKAWSTVSPLVIVEICSEPPNLFWSCLETFLTCIAIGVIYPLWIITLTWKQIFILSCVAVSLDPLFFYIPIIDEENKCLGTDKWLRTVALIFRSLTDIAFIFHNITLIRGWRSHYPKWDDDSNSNSDDPAAPSFLPLRLNLVQEAIAKKMPWLSNHIIVNFLAILPIPQVAILVVFLRMGGSDLFLKQTIINIFLVLQCLLRVFQMYLSSKEVGETAGKWVKGSFYFFLYILASHVLAAFWYFISIQRETTCWDQACRTIAGCVSIFDCGRNTSLNRTFLNELCPIQSPNATLFDFGIFLDILQSGNTGHINFPTKFFYSLWWGLRNLSNFGTNLQTSSNVWENCFAILICVTGLLLLLYLIGNVQTYIQSETQKLVTIEESRRTRINARRGLIEEWMSSHGLTDTLKIEVRNNIREDILVEFINEDVDIEFMHTCYFRGIIKSDLREFVCEHALKKVPMLQDMDGKELKKFYTHLIYSRGITCKESGSYIVQAGEPLDAMYLIIDGVIKYKDAEETSMIAQTTSRSQHHFGEEALRWAISNYKRSYNRDPIPISNVEVQCQTKVIAFKFKIDELVEILCELDKPERLEALVLPHDSNTNHQILNEGELSTKARKWICPERGWVKLNCSSVWNRDSKLADLGWVLRDDGGAFIAAGSIRGIPCMDKFYADALTVRKAMEFCPLTTAFSDSMRGTFSNACFVEDWPYSTRRRQNKVPLKIVLESDNQLLIDCLIKGPSSPRDHRIATKLKPIIDGIGWDASAFEAITFLHCKHQSCNAAAHCVAMHAKDDPSNVSEWHSTPPSWLTSALNQDIETCSAAAAACIPKTNMQLATTDTKEELRQKMKIKKQKDTLDWLSRNDVPEDMNPNILNSINKNNIVEKNMDADVDVDFIFACLPRNIKLSIKRHLGMNALKKVPMLQNMHEYVLEIICNHLEPVIYKKNSYVVGAGEPLGLMIFILSGTIMLTDTTSSSEITKSCDDKFFGKGGFYGEQLLSWASPNNIYYSDHPVISTSHVKCQTKVEALILKAEDLRSAVSKCGSQWNFNNCMTSQKLVANGRDSVANTGASAPASINIERTIQLHQGHDIILEQLILIRETMLQRLDDQGRRLDEMAAFLARLGFNETTRLVVE